MKILVEPTPPLVVDPSWYDRNVDALSAAAGGLVIVKLLLNVTVIVNGLVEAVAEGQTDESVTFTTKPT